MRTVKVVVAVALFAFVVCLSSCGKQEGSVSPVTDTVPPNPPAGLSIGLEPDRVMISWEENAEPDLAGYRIYKSSNEQGPFRLATPQLILCPWYYDTPTPMEKTFYKVTAVDQSGNESAYSQVIGIYFDNLQSGRGSVYHSVSN